MADCKRALDEASGDHFRALCTLLTPETFREKDQAFRVRSICGKSVLENLRALSRPGRVAQARRGTREPSRNRESPSPAGRPCAWLARGAVRSPSAPGANLRARSQPGCQVGVGLASRVPSVCPCHPLPPPFISGHPRCRSGWFPQPPAQNLPDCYLAREPEGRSLRRPNLGRSSTGQGRAGMASAGRTIAAPPSARNRCLPKGGKVKGGDDPRRHIAPDPLP
jgi:hypothetical protein